MWRKCRAYQSYGDGFSALKWTNTMNDSQVNILAFQHFEPSDPNAHAVNMWAMTLTSDQIWGNIYGFFFRFEFLDQKISTHSVLCEMFAILKNLLEIWKAYVYVILRNSSTNLSASLAVNSYSTRLCYFQRVIPHGNRTALFLCLRLLPTKSKLTFEKKKQNKNCELIKTHVIAANFQRCIFPTTTDLTTTPTTAKC